MRFQSHAQRAKYVVKPRFKVLSQDGLTAIPRPGLMARFLNHTFDSETAQRTLGWTDEDRREVEAHLLQHYDFGKPHGIYLILTDQERVEQGLENVPMPAQKRGMRCIAFFANEDGEMEQCGNEPLPNSQHCKLHVEQFEEARAARGTVPPETPEATPEETPADAVGA